MPTPTGAVTLTIPPGDLQRDEVPHQGAWGGRGRRLRIAGDLFAEAQIVMPKKLDEADRQLLRQLDQRYPLNPRRDLRW